MEFTGIRSLDRSANKTLEWINELGLELGFDNKQKTYLILRATLHGIRDRLTIDEATNFAALLPLLLKGPFYEEFRPSLLPIKVKTKEEFFALIESETKFTSVDIDASVFVPKVFKFLSKKISSSEIEKIKKNIPKDIAQLWEPISNTQELKTSSLKLISPAFADMLNIPQKYTCEGENINPPLEFLGIPHETKSLLLIIDDPDAKPVVGHVFDHWIVANINPLTSNIKENSTPEGSIVLKNSKGENKYTGPCPPDKEHRYFFKLYALNKVLSINENTTKKELIEMIIKYTIDHDEIVGTYELLKNKK